MIQTPSYLRVASALKSKDRFHDLRKAYPTFKYDEFSIGTTNGNLQITFRYSIPPDIEFSHSIVFEDIPSSRVQKIPPKDLKNLAFHLGLVEMLSYWKSTCSPEIEIRSGYLNSEQLKWWQDLLIHGMGEYFYTNEIDFTRDDLLKLSAKNVGMAEHKPYLRSLRDWALVQVSGGRDSALTLAMLRGAGRPFNAVLINPVEAASAVAEIGECSKPVVVRRTLDPLLFELNSHGFLNGHTPFSASLAFVSAMCLVLYNYRDIVVSNERSSNEGNLFYCGEEVNHQYSKSLRFEMLFNEYMRRYLVKEGRYFSFMRPLFELQIGRTFSHYPEFFKAFRSCNRNQKQGTWCGSCPKCLSVFMTLYPFVDTAKLIEIFGKDLFDEESSIPVLRQLTGTEGHKPFECVCTTDEAKLALSLSIEEVARRGLALPKVLEYWRSQYVDTLTSKKDSILYSFGTHNMPLEYDTLLKAATAPFHETG